MLSLPECKQLLGDEAENMTDGEVERLRDDLYSVADVLVDVCLSPRQQSSVEPNAESGKVEALTCGR